MKKLLKKKELIQGMDGIERLLLTLFTGIRFIALFGYIFLFYNSAKASIIKLIF